jgi:hypothetical protein
MPLNLLDLLNTISNPPIPDPDARLEGGDQLSPVGEWPAPIHEGNIEATIAEWQEQATADASAFPGRTCTYIVEAFGASGALLAGRRFNARGSEISSVGGPTEGPSAHGLTAQLMRHLEFQAKLAAESKLSVLSDAERLIGLLTEQLKARDAEIAIYRGRERETVELFANLKSGENQYRLASAKQELEAKESAEGRQRFWSIATPVLLSKLGAAASLPALPAQGGASSPAAPASPGDTSSPSIADAAAVVDPVALDLMGAFATAQVPIEAVFSGAPPELQTALNGFFAKYGPALRARAAVQSPVTPPPNPKE